MKSCTQFLDIVWLKVQEVLLKASKVRSGSAFSVIVVVSCPLVPASVGNLLRLLLLVVVELDAVLQVVVFGHQRLVLNLLGVLQDLACDARQILVGHSCLYPQPPLLLRVLAVNRGKSKSCCPLWVLPVLDPR